MQNDLDANHFQIWNLDTSNLNLQGNPQNTPPVANFWIDGYNNQTLAFHVSQPKTLNLSDWPSPTGHGGQFLGTLDGINYSWQTPQGGGGGGGAGFTGYINVKQAPFNAKGDGVTDDYNALQGAINAAANTAGGGLTVYFPAGTYYCSKMLTAPSAAPMSLLGDAPLASIIKANPASTDIAVLTISAQSQVMNLGFDGNMVNGTQPVPQKYGIWCNGGNAVIIDNCTIFFCSASGISLANSWQSVVRNCTISNCGGYGIVGYFSPQLLVYGNLVQLVSESGIWLVNCQASTAASNQVYQSGQYGYGLGFLDSDNSQVVDNLAQQCAVGILCSISATRATGTNWDKMTSYGYVVAGNTVTRNYFGGVQFIYAHGFNMTGNNLADNGQGGSDNATYTVEPGLMVPLNAQGTGYHVGDIVTLSGGTGTPAKAIVTRVSGGGAVYPEGLLPITFGAYTTFPTNPCPVTGGSGTGLQVILTISTINAAGSGYKVGQTLRSNTPTYYNPVRILVTGVNQTGAITKYTVTDGGGYTGTLPVLLSFVGDAYTPIQGPISGNPGSGTGSGGTDTPDLPDQGSGFQLNPCWGRRYSSIFNGATTFNLETYHAIAGGVVSGNTIDTCKTGCGYLNVGVSNLSDRAGALAFTGNIVIRNLYSFQGQTVGSPLDNNYSLNGAIFANNVIV